MYAFTDAGGNIDFEECNHMVDAFMKAEFTYFDTAKGYLGGLSEAAVRECVVKRYPRESFTLTDKLTMNFFDKIRTLLAQVAGVFEK